MKFWDSSAIIPLLVEEQSVRQLDKIFQEDPVMLVWWGTSIECVSAVSRLEREGGLSAKEALDIIARLDTLRSCWREVQPSSQLRQIAERILRLHPLRAQDAQQLAAGIIANRDHPVPLVTLDDRLNIAARNEGLPVV